MQKAPAAGYSGTPLPKKLGLREGHRVALLGAPDGFDGTLGALPAGVAIITSVSAKAPADVALLFVRSRAELERAFSKVTRGLTAEGALWVAWPKKTSGVATDLSEDTLREVCLPTGYVDNKVCAIDATWSGLRFVLRLENRPAKRR
jgi:hypothetical protein